MLLNELITLRRLGERVVVLYHDLCMDGFAAAALLYRGFPDAEFIPVNYDRMPELDPKYTHVIFADITPPALWAAENKPRIDKLYILDHHKDKAEDIRNIVKLYNSTVYAGPTTDIRLNLDALYIDFRLDTAGSGLVWDNLEFGKQVPKTIDLINRRDLWVLNREERKYHEVFFPFIKKGRKDEIFPPFLKLVDYSDKKFDKKIEPIADALAINLTQNIEFFLNKAVVKEAKIPYLNNGEPINIAYFNAPYFYASETASRYLDKDPSVDLVINMTVNGDKTGLSLRSRLGTGYASTVARRFSGGGHADAAGGRFDSVVGFTALNELVINGVLPDV